MAMQASGVAIDGDPATLLARLCRPSTLKDLGKQRRRLERAGAVRVTRADTPEAVEDLFQALVVQRRTRFAAMAGSIFWRAPRSRPSTATRAQAGLAGGPARLLASRWTGSGSRPPIASSTGASSTHPWTTTSDERWRNASPARRS